MSKRLRFLIVIVVLVAVGFMLWPTIQWYFLWDQSTRDQASYTVGTIKNEAQRFAQQGVLVFNNRYELDKTAALDLSAASDGFAIDDIPDSLRLEAFSALKDEVLKLYKKAKHKVPSTLSYDLVKGAFVATDETTTIETLDLLAQENMKTVLEAYKREQLFSFKDKADRIIQLGLDLAGGVSYTLEADIEGYAESENKIAYEAALEEATLKLQEKNSSLTKEEAQEQAKSEGISYKEYNLSSSSNVDKIMEIAIQQITERVDIYGASEPDIRRIGKNWIQVDLPGAKDPERLKRLLMGKGSLNFHVVDDEQTSLLYTWLSENYNNPQLVKILADFNDGQVLPVNELAGIKSGYIVVGTYDKDSYREDRRSGWTVIKEEPGMAGSLVDGAYVSQADSAGAVATSFRLSAAGQKAFGAMTKDATNESPVTIAVVMDGKCKMSAAAREQLNNSMLQVSGRGINYQEAQDFAQLLTLGSKEVGIEVLNSDIIGSGLGEDYIKRGIKGLDVALLLIFAFMILYYLGGGIVANIALVLNIFIMAGVLSQIQLTLTLAGLAGLILTVGMAVDANVIIYERIKEERRLGKSAASALRAGYKKAFVTILDSNITTFIAAVVLSYFGSSTVKGFAMILAVGIFSSMFTALVVSRLMLDFGVETLKAKRLLISWRR